MEWRQIDHFIVGECIARIREMIEKGQLDATDEDETVAKGYFEAWDNNFFDRII